MVDRPAQVCGVHHLPVFSCPQDSERSEARHDAARHGACEKNTPVHASMASCDPPAAPSTISSSPGQINRHGHRYNGDEQPETDVLHDLRPAPEPVCGQRSENWDGVESEMNLGGRYRSMGKITASNPGYDNF